MSNKLWQNLDTVWTDKKRILGMPISFTRYTLATDHIETTKLFVKTGILSTIIDEINLYRVYDIKITQSLGQKLFGVGTVILYSNDVSLPISELVNIKNPYEIRTLFSKEIEKARDIKGVRIGEFY